MKIENIINFLDVVEHRLGIYDPSLLFTAAPEDDIHIELISSEGINKDCVDNLYDITKAFLESEDFEIIDCHIEGGEHRIPLGRIRDGNNLEQPLKHYLWDSIPSEYPPEEEIDDSDLPLEGVVEMRLEHGERYGGEPTRYLIISINLPEKAGVDLSIIESEISTMRKYGFHPTGFDHQPYHRYTHIKFAKDIGDRPPTPSESAPASEDVLTELKKLQEKVNKLIEKIEKEDE